MKDKMTRFDLIKIAFAERANEPMSIKELVSMIDDLIAEYSVRFNDMKFDFKPKTEYNVVSSILSKHWNEFKRVSPGCYCLYDDIYDHILESDLYNDHIKNVVEYHPSNEEYDDEAEDDYDEEYREIPIQNIKNAHRCKDKACCHEKDESCCHDKKKKYNKIYPGFYKNEVLKILINTEGDEYFKSLYYELIDDYND